jgi:hypothetical protein
VHGPGRFNGDGRAGSDSGEAGGPQRASSRGGPRGWWVGKAPDGVGGEEVVVGS